jgi:Sugar transferases involved in lipopolysaccharide synthesis
MAAEGALVDVGRTREGEVFVGKDGNSLPSKWEIGKLPLGGNAKRIFDVAVSAALIVFFLPLFAVIAIMVKLSSPGPALFGHRRLGHRGVPFRCYKFRTMVTNSNEVLADLLSRDPVAREEWNAKHKLRKDPRVTSFGQFLRTSSLDELPQLFNVLLGDMSLVGPRPIVTEEIQRYRHHFMDYASARPGMTGLWQVSGRSNCDYDRRVQLDVTYVRNWNLLKDFVILLRTVKVVFAREGSR